MLRSASARLVAIPSINQREEGERVGVGVGVGVHSLVGRAVQG
jgi:hypothetical protein